MSSKGIKYERVVTGAELQPLYKALNNFLANDKEVGNTFEIDSLKKAEVSIKRQPDGFKLKVKLSPTETACETSGNESACLDNEANESEEGPGEESGGSGDDGNEEKPRCDDGSKPRYKELKKRMDKDFDIIKKSVKNKEMPPAGTVKRFMEDSDMMCRFRDKGEKFYAVYLSECGEFKKAFDAADINSFEFHTKRLNDLKKSCHKKYK